MYRRYDVFSILIAMVQLKFPTSIITVMYHISYM